MLEPLPGVGECQQSCPASVQDLVFSVQPQRGRIARKGEAALEGVGGNPEDARFFSWLISEALWDLLMESPAEKVGTVS